MTRTNAAGHKLRDSGEIAAVDARSHVGPKSVT